MRDQDRIADAIKRLNESTATLTWPAEAKSFLAGCFALVQQWRETAAAEHEKADAMSVNFYEEEAWEHAVRATSLKSCADQLERLITGEGK